VPGELVQSLACHPTQPDVACGFSNGKLRVFHIPTTSLIQEQQLHQGGIFQVCCADMHKAGCIKNCVGAYVPPQQLFGSCRQFSSLFASTAAVQLGIPKHLYVCR
jgi:hypothetical protein